MGAEGPLVGPPVFKTDGDGAPVLVCSIRTRPRQLRTALLVRGSAGAAKPLNQAGRFFASNRDPLRWARGWGPPCGRPCEKDLIRKPMDETERSVAHDFPP